MFEYRLLAVEDDVEVAHLLRRVSLEAGFDGYVASIPKGIVPMYWRVKPDVIVMDIMMPDITQSHQHQHLRSQQVINVC